MEKKYIFFDLDGTLTDPMIGITKSVQYALKHFDIVVEDLNELCPFIGPPLKESFMVFYGLTEQEAEVAIAKYRERFSETGLFENKVYQGISEVLENLKQQGKTLMVATSKPTVFAERILAHFNLDHYFDFVGGSNLDGSRTKKSEVIEFVLRENNITDVSEVIMIGDRKHDMIGAEENGMDAIGVLYGYGNFEELSDAGAKYIVKEVKELVEIIAS
jgi:phosphoglycolate phosphatase